MCDKPKDKKKCKATCSSQQNNRQDEPQGPSEDIPVDQEHNIDFQAYGPEITEINASQGYDLQESGYETIPRNDPSFGRTAACKNKMDGAPCGSRQPKTPENIPVAEESEYQTIPRNDFQKYGRSASCQEKVGGVPYGARQTKTPEPVANESEWQTIPKNDFKKYGRTVSCQAKVGGVPCGARQPKTPEKIPVENESEWQTIPRNDFQKYGRTARCQAKIDAAPCGARSSKTPENQNFKDIPVEDVSQSGFETMPRFVLEIERTGTCKQKIGAAPCGSRTPKTPENIPAAPEPRYQTVSRPAYPEYARTGVCQQKLGSPMIYENSRATSYSFEKRTTTPASQSTPKEVEQYYSVPTETPASMSGYYDSSFPSQSQSPQAVGVDMSSYESSFPAQPPSPQSVGVDSTFPGQTPSPPPFQPPPSAQYYPEQSSPSVPPKKKSLEKPICGECPESKISIDREKGKKKKSAADTDAAAPKEVPAPAEGKRRKSTLKQSTNDTIEVIESTNKSEERKSSLKRQSLSSKSPTKLSISTGKSQPRKSIDSSFARKQSESMLRRRELGSVSIRKYSIKNEELEALCNVRPPSVSSRDSKVPESRPEYFESSERIDLNQLRESLSCCMSMPTCCRPPRINPVATRFAHLSESLKTLKADDQRLLEARQDSINMLSVVISTVMLLAVDMPEIPPSYLLWSNKYLSCIKNLQGQHPINVKKILEMINRRERASPVTTPIESTPETPKKEDSSKSKNESSIRTTKVIPTFKYDYCACPYIPRLATVEREK